MAHGPGLRDGLHDHVALDEIELYAEVLIAVAGADHPLSPTEIDRALGLTSETRVGEPPEPPSFGTAPAPGDTEPDNTNLNIAAPRSPEPTGDEPTGPSPAEPVGTGPNDSGPTASEPEVRFVGPVPPARDGRHPPTVVLPLHGALSDNVGAPNPLCGPFPPQFVPWRAWYA